MNLYQTADPIEIPNSIYGNFDDETYIEVTTKYPRDLSSLIIIQMQI